MPSKGIAVTVARSVNASSAHAFDTIVPIDLPSVFKGFGPLPAVAGTQDQVGNWDTVGQSRRVNLSDGSHATEQIDEYARPDRFGYTVGPFSGIVGKLVDRAEGEWRFSEQADGAQIEWTYTWFARRGAKPLIWPLTLLWRRYADRVLADAAALVEETS